MRLVDFDLDPALLQQFLEWPRQLYAGDPNWLDDPSAARLLSAGVYQGAIWRNFLVLDGSHVLGRLTASANHLLTDDDGHPFGQLGFFECVDDPAAARLLVGAASEWLRLKIPQSRSVLAPMAFDTWHSYRLRTSGFDASSFQMEPYNPPHYPDLFASLGFAAVSHYVTKTVTDLPRLLRLWEPYHRRAVARGYRFRTFNPADSAGEMSLLYRLSTSIFKQNPFYVDIPEAEFRCMYGGAAGQLDPDLLIFVTDPTGEPVGFSFSMPDPRQPGTINVKTLGTLARVHGLGIGAALAHEIYRRFEARGFTRVNHCLMRAGNLADLLDRHKAQVTREYTLYSRALTA